MAIDHRKDVLGTVRPVSRSRAVRIGGSDHLTGANERPKAERWVPRWMAFPPSAYTERGGVPRVSAATRTAWMVEGEEEEAKDAAAPAEDVPEVPEAEPLAA